MVCAVERNKKYGSSQQIKEKILEFHAIAIPGFSEPVSCWTHFIAAFISLIGIYFLWKKARGNNVRLGALYLYSFSLIFLFSMSGVYHLLDHSTVARDVFQRLDHAGIWVLIAGTFTPIHVILFRGSWRWLILTIVWSIAITGLTLEVIFFKSIPEWLSLSFYLSLGWLGVLTSWKFRRSFSHKSIMWMIFGGIFYSIGAVMEFTRWPVLIDGVIGPHEVFHVFVMLGAFSHWMFIYSWADQAVSRHIVVHIKELPESQFQAIGINEYLFFKSQNLDNLKVTVIEELNSRYHHVIKPKFVLKYFKEEVI